MANMTAGITSCWMWQAGNSTSAKIIARERTVEASVRPNFWATPTRISL